MEVRVNKWFGGHADYEGNPDWTQRQRESRDSWDGGCTPDIFLIRSIKNKQAITVHSLLLPNKHPITTKPCAAFFLQDYLNKAWTVEKWHKFSLAIGHNLEVVRVRELKIVVFFF